MEIGIVKHEGQVKHATYYNKMTQYCILEVDNKVHLHLTSRYKTLETE